MPRFTTLEQIDRAGHDVRLWCYHCQRAATIDGIVWTHFEERGLSTRLGDVQRYFPCKACGARDPLILPCTARNRRPTTPTELVAAFFHGMRSQSKKVRRR